MRLSGRKFQDVELTWADAYPPYMARLTRGSLVRHDQTSIGDGGQERWTWVGRVSTGIQVPCV